MRVCILAVTLIGALCAAAPASADPGPVSARSSSPPFVDHVPGLSGPSGASCPAFGSIRRRRAAWPPSNSDRSTPEADEAWAEVLGLAPQADTPGMRDQFRCHWDFAENVEPGKTSWNLEPWRPVVD